MKQNDRISLRKTLPRIGSESFPSRNSVKLHFPASEPPKNICNESGPNKFHLEIFAANRERTKSKVSELDS